MLTFIGLRNATDRTRAVEVRLPRFHLPWTAVIAGAHKSRSSEGQAWANPDISE